MRLAVTACALISLTALVAAQERTPPTRSTLLWSHDPIAITIEFLTIDASGKETVTSTKRTAIGPPVPLEFLLAPDRYVRMSYQGASPRTFSTSELFAQKKVHVPDVLPGGELLLIFPDAKVRPVRVELRGLPRTVSRDITNDPHLSLSGLPPAEYRIGAYYKGNVPASFRSAVVRSGASTVHLMPTEQVGAVIVKSANSDVCGLAESLTVNSLAREITEAARTGQGQALPAATVRTLMTSVQRPSCHEEIGGLPPGSYQASYTASNAALGTATGTVRAQEVSEIVVASRLAHVSGRATMNGRPLRNTRLFIAPTLGSLLASSGNQPRPSSVMTMTDPNGFYTFVANEPGRYRATVTTTGNATEREITLVEGPQQLGLAFQGGVVAVTLEGWNETDRVSVRATSPGKISVVTWSPSLTPEGPEIVGLPYGNYEISIEVNGHAYPGLLRRATLSAASPEARLTVDLTKR